MLPRHAGIFTSIIITNIRVKKSVIKDKDAIQPPLPRYSQCGRGARPEIKRMWL
jgi:hypothetical protein